MNMEDFDDDDSIIKKLDEDLMVIKTEAGNTTLPAKTNVSLINAALISIIYMIRNGIFLSGKYFNKLIENVAKATRGIYLVESIFIGLDTAVSLGMTSLTFVYDQIFKSHPNIVAAAASILYSTIYGYIFGAWLGNIFWINIETLNSIHNILTLGSGISFSGIMGTISAAPAIAYFLTPKLGELLAEFNLGPGRDDNKKTQLEKIEANSIKSSLLRRLMFGGGAVCLLAFYLTAPALLVVDGGPLKICYALYNILFAWIPTNIFSISFILFLPEFFNFLINIKQGDMENALCSFTARATIINVILSLLTGGLFIPINGNYIQKIISDHLTTSSTFKNMVASGISSNSIFSKVKESTVNLLGVINNYIGTEKSSINSLKDIVLKFKDMVVSFMTILGNNRLSIICSFLVALVVIYYLFYNERVDINNKIPVNDGVNTSPGYNTDKIGSDYIASCMEDLITAQSIIIDFCNIVVEQGETAQLNLNKRVKDFKNKLESLGKDCVEFKKYFDPNLFDSLDYLTILENIHDNIERLMYDLGNLLTRLDIDNGKKMIFAGEIHSIYTHIKTKLILKMNIVQGLQREIKIKTKKSIL